MSDHSIHAEGVHTMMALEGIKVVEMGVFAIAPAAAMLLGDWGANVVKIEDTSGGDPMRGLAAIIGVPFSDFNPYVEVDNRNKRAIAVNLKAKAGQDIAYQLVRNADVFVSNMRVDALAALGMSYEALADLNPRLIYAHANGYGLAGEDALKGGLDVGAYWARGGFAAQIAPDGAPPVPSGLLAALGDHPSGMFLAGGIAIALFARERTGKGQRVEGSLLRSAVWTMGLNLMATAALAPEGRELPRYNHAKAQNPLANVYQTKDGRYLQLLMVQADRYWPEFCRLMGLDHFERDPKFATLADRAAHAEELIATLDALFLTRTREEWISYFRGTAVMYDPINSLADMLVDEQVLANDYLTEFDHPKAGKIRVPRGPVELCGMPATIRKHAPELGEDTEDVLLELGYDWDQIVSLRDEGVIL